MEDEDPGPSDFEVHGGRMPQDVAHGASYRDRLQIDPTFGEQTVRRDISLYHLNLTHSGSHTPLLLGVFPALIANESRYGSECIAPKAGGIRIQFVSPHPREKFAGSFSGARQNKAKFTAVNQSVL